MPGPTAALLALERGRVSLFVACLAVASSFHATALILIGLLLPAVPGRSLALRLLVLAVVGAVLVFTFLVSRLDGLLAGYIEAQYQSDGTAVRVAMNLLPALLLLLWPQRFALSAQQRRIWLPLAAAAIACAVLLLVLPQNSTAIDRLALYLIPLQLLAGSRVPSLHLFWRDPLRILPAVMAVAVQLVWLNFGSFAGSWLPYRTVLWPHG